MQINTRLSPSTFRESLGMRLVHCNTHRSWYWQKHVLHSGWLCIITLRPVFNGEEVHWLFIHFRCYSFTHIRNWLVVTLLTGRLISHSLYALYCTVWLTTLSNTNQCKTSCCFPTTIFIHCLASHALSQRKGLVMLQSERNYQTQQ